MNIKEAVSITGGLSQTTKMPCASYNLPASCCTRGQVLAKLTGTVCSGCYATKGRYTFHNVKIAQAKRHAAISHPKWVEAMICLIRNTNKKYFRWHDSGDIQSEDHLNNICEIAKALPKVKFWLPTKEGQLVTQYTNKTDLPDNLLVRVSADHLNKEAPAKWKYTSIVYTKEVNPHDISSDLQLCKAYEHVDHACGTCRKCWSKEVKTIAYPHH